MLQEATANLVLVDSGTSHYCPAKLYEVLFAGRPILLLSPQGVATSLARRSTGCWIAHPDDENGIRSCLVQLYEAFVQKRLHSVSRDEKLGFYDRAHQARRLLRFCQRLAGPHCSSPLTVGDATPVQPSASRS
jgi:hypothetical protein